MPLTMAVTGAVSTVKKITGTDSIRQFLGSLGFVTGEKVSIVSEVGGDLIVSVKDSRVALSRALAVKIIV
ncbi:MAG: ferrous iron transport protein A [Spirochaetaceae bacterium]|nr:ferrous iron transport protein A [Spirochaetaceae bacterium]